MKNEKARRIAGAVMLGAALLFFIYALGHPEGSFAMENSTTYLFCTWSFWWWRCSWCSPQRRNGRPA